ncbi:MAG: EAL domain-containing protein [Spirochaetia bacterium]|nr:EAL domain-containing protein [Spirochaetia bacterium]
MKPAAKLGRRMTLDFQNARILVVDDQKANVELIERILAHEGYKNLMSTNSPDEGIRIARETDPDLLILDLMMPEVDGFAVMSALEADKRPFHPILVISAAGQQDLKTKALQCGARDYLDKPFNRAELVSRVRNLLEIRLLTRQMESQNRALEDEVDRRTHAFMRESLTDQLTSLGNRYQLEVDLLKNAAVDLLCLNIEAWSEVSYGYGAEVADNVLRTFADLIRGFLIAGEKAYRYSSDQFIVASPVAGRTEDIAEFIQNKMESEPIRVSDIVVYLNISTGLVTRDAPDILKKADIVLRAIRGQGFVAIGGSLDDHHAEEKFRENLKRSRRVVEAIGNGGFVPHFQPIRDNKTGRIERYESLARMVVGGEVFTPAFFLSAVQRMGMGHLLTETMVLQSFVKAAASGLSVSLNLSVHDFKRGNLLETVTRAMDATGMPARNVIFEVLEDINTLENPAGMAMMEALRTLGCRIAIDDFGTHYSNFVSVLDLAPDLIKIDATFIKQLPTSERSYQIARAITGFAHSCGAQVVAEYVHSEEVQAKVLELGIDYSQGELFGMAAAEFLSNGR